jgi:hypothetical protein
MNNVNILLNMNVELFLISDAVLGIILRGGLLLWGLGWSPLPWKASVRRQAGRQAQILPACLPACRA